VATSRLALSADVRNELTTSDNGGGGGGGAAASEGVAPPVSLVELDEDVNLPAARAISVANARACAARWVATTVSVAAICGGLPTAPAAAAASALSRLA
jgi:hypothetical protein